MYSLVPAEAPRDPNLLYFATMIPHLYRWNAERTEKTRLIGVWVDRDSHVRSLRAYEESEANCNTCVHLVRKPHDPKKNAGFLVGECQVTKDPLRFHPEDPLHKPCWVSRRPSA